MVLKAKKPEVKKGRLKLFMFGKAKIGKSTLSYQFPSPYVLDTDGSTNKPKYVKLISDRGGVSYESQDFEELLEQVKDLMTLEHNYKTLVIDSLTLFYDDLLENCAKKVTTDFGRHYGLAKTRMKHLIRLLLRLDMNVIITSQAKNEYGKNLEVMKQTFDCFKDMEYLFDLILEVQKRGESRIARVTGTRLDEFEEGDMFPCSYEEFSNRYGQENLERNTIIEELATQEQIQELLKLINFLKIPDITYSKWLKKSKADEWNEMTKDDIQKCIDYMQSRVKEETESLKNATNLNLE